MGRAKTTLLVVAAAMCMAVLLTPVASAGKPPPLKITMLTVSGQGLQSPQSVNCDFNLTVAFQGHMKHGDYLKLSDGIYTYSRQLGHEKSPLTATGFLLDDGDFSAPSGNITLTVSILAKDHSTVLTHLTVQVPLNGSCPTGTYTSS